MKDPLNIIESMYPYDHEVEYIKDGHVYCKKCHERLDEEVIQFLGTKVFSRNCKCKREQRKAYEESQRLERIKVLKKSCFQSPIQWQHTFENFKGEATQPYIIAKNFAKEFAKMQADNIGLLFYGNVGSGKSYLANAIANYLIEQEVKVLIKNFSEIINDIYVGGFKLDKNEYIGKLANAPLLILDDLGIERDTAFAKEQVYHVINARYLKQKPTIITTNLSLETIMNAESDVEYRRIYSRIVEMCIPVMVVRSDLRVEIQKKKLDKVKKTLLQGGGEI